MLFVFTLFIILLAKLSQWALIVSLRYFEISLVGQKQDETTGVPGFPG